MVVHAKQIEKQQRSISRRLPTWRRKQHRRKERIKAAGGMVEWIRNRKSAARAFASAHTAQIRQQRAQNEPKHGLQTAMSGTTWW